MATKSLTFSIIGCGRIAQRHARHIAHHGKLVSVGDIIPGKAHELAAQYGARSFTSAEELLNSELPDLVAVCSPNGWHARHTMAALNAGCHVLCEKPMAISSADCKAMISAAEKAGRRLFIVKQNRYNPPIAALKKLIEENRLGKLLSIQINCFWNRDAAYYANSWKGSKDLDGGTLFTQFSHFIDLLYWLVGDIKKVKAFTCNSNHQQVIEFEDQGMVILEFGQGTQGTIHYTVNSHKKNMEGSITVFGEKGTVKVGGQYLNELEYQDIENYVIKDLPAGNPANNYGHYQGSMSNHDKVYANVVAALSAGTAEITSGQEGLKTVEIIERIYAAAKE